MMSMILRVSKGRALVAQTITRLGERLARPVTRRRGVDQARAGTGRVVAMVSGPAHRLILAVLCVLLVAGALVLAPSGRLPDARATAYSCTGYGWIGVPGTGYKTSRWCVQTTGQSRYVHKVTGVFTAMVGGVYLCNTRMKVAFCDSLGVNYLTMYSGTNSGCRQAGGAFSVTPNRYARTGHVAVSLLSYGQTIATVRHNIYP